MTMDRRTFIGTITAATVLGSRLSWAADDRKIDKIGVQLYTVRDAMKSDMEGTLAKVAQIGYKEVEFAGLFDHSPKDVRAMLDKNGLTAVSGHTPYETLTGDWQKTLEDAKTLGQTYIVCPWVDDKLLKQPDGWKKVGETLNRAGETSKKAGLQLAYHNHAKEFVKVDGKLAYDILLDNTDPNLVQMEMDLYWITKGGQDPLKYFDRYPGRFPLVHVKDMAKDGGFAPVGTGTMDFKRIFAQSEKAGIKHYFVENDEPKSPFEDIRISFENLQKMRF
jgi:sugar phosphate isomerase/epimerase